jgi:hypothetical protein
MSQSCFQIGDLGKHAGVSVDAFRYYERLNLLSRDQCVFGEASKSITQGCTNSVEDRESAFILDR